MDFGIYGLSPTTFFVFIFFFFPASASSGKNQLSSSRPGEYCPDQAKPTAFFQCCYESCAFVISKLLFP